MINIVREIAEFTGTSISTVVISIVIAILVFFIVIIVTIGLLVYKNKRNAVKEVKLFPEHTQDELN